MRKNIRTKYRDGWSCFGDPQQQKVGNTWGNPSAVSDCLLSSWRTHRLVFQYICVAYFISWTFFYLHTSLQLYLDLCIIATWWVSSLNRPRKASSLKMNMLNVTVDPDSGLERFLTMPLILQDPKEDTWHFITKHF